MSSGGLMNPDGDAVELSDLNLVFLPPRVKE